MKLTIDTDASTLVLEAPDGSRRMSLYTADAFDVLAELWVRVGWALKYSYRFTWMGRPIIQLPEDIVRIQEVIYEVRPSLIIETGVAHGGSLVYYAGLLRAMGGGRVLGIDIEIRPENRAAIEAHELSGAIQLLEGSSTSGDVLAKVKELVGPRDRVLVILDSAHDRDHVRAELEAYSPLVSHGSFIVATDGVMRDLTDVPRGRPDWATDNPSQAALDFAAAHPEFTLSSPPSVFNESNTRAAATYWPNAYLRRTG